MDDDFAAREYANRLLRGARTRLVPSSAEHLEILERWWNDPETGVWQHSTIKPKPAGAVAATLREWSSNADPGGCGFSVENFDGEFVGHVVLFGATLPVRAATFAVHIGPECQGRGYGLDCTRTMINYGFCELGLNRIALNVWSFNQRAINAYRKAGFVAEGRLRQAVFHDGRFFDNVVMAILYADWAARQSMDDPRGG